MPGLWANVSEVDKQWAAGNICGDGCVSVKHLVVVSVTKAERNISALHKLQALFGGKLDIVRAAVERRQQQRCWRLTGPDAVSFCRMIAPYTRAKTPQFSLAGKFPYLGRKKPMWATRYGQIKHFDSIGDAAEEFKVSRTVLDRLLNAVTKTLNGWMFFGGQTEARKEIVKERKRIKEQLVAMKKVAHLPVTSSLTLPYCAGFFDAEVSVVDPQLSCSSMLDI